MTFQIPIDCLNEIIEYLEEDRHTLYSCLLVNRLWCEISVRILWRNIVYKDIQSFEHDKLFELVDSSILNTLFTCLPNESKGLLYQIEIFISTPISKRPLFNYATFCKALSIFKIKRMVDNVFKFEPSINSLNIKDRNCLVTNELIKMFANQIFSLKKLSYYHYPINFSFPYFPGMRDLSELHCCSCLPSKFFHQLSQLCQNLQSISISFCDGDISNELKELISLQNNLQTLTLKLVAEKSSRDIIPILEKRSNTITKLHLYSNNDNLSYSFVSSFTNLQEFIFSLMGGINIENFNILRYVNFSKLQTLKIPYQCPNPEDIMKFLENNGKNLKKFYIEENYKELHLSIPILCPNLKSLFLLFYKNDLDSLKTILINCQYLESLKIWCGKGYSNEYLPEKEVLEIVANHSSNNFCELKIHNLSNSEVSVDDLESFFLSWRNRIPKKLLSLITIKDNCKCLDDYEENMEIIEKYENLGIVRFRTISYEGDEREEEVSYYYN
ncbi:hypothetical protein RclHR1_08510007 [Rhizophagus clarus]|uniref:F-box domain-containing protein n=1 Tax=Rhizophagus clarus TaxID=94130 RepID=A0A2Z6S3C7_9GLOM|nr:hypothetical protein RclHR1_08510007 [Rhizophagus clarus]GES88163.1 hypothetical protein GLOIN_2v1876445 [Rhizophagus clarus]